MQYYKIRPQADQKRYSSKKGCFFIANELYTIKQAEKIGLKHFENNAEKVEINKNQTYYFFGARFGKKYK